MKPQVNGLHHITIMFGDPTENADFYVNKLGLRMIKKTVNHDAPNLYHLFYGDKRGTPGSSITFFPNITQKNGKIGAGQVTELGLRIPETSLGYWENRLEELEISHQRQQFHNKNSLVLEDPDGLPIRLYPESSDGFESWEGSKVSEEHQIQGMSHVSMTVSNPERTEKLLEQVNLQKLDEGWFEAEDGSNVELKESNKSGISGKGTVHHIAFKVENEEQEQIREKVQSMGFQPSPLISRKYFTSFYFREANGILFEFSNMQPGYTADESVEELGTNFVLPETLEPKREQILNSLDSFDESVIR